MIESKSNNIWSTKCSGNNRNMYIIKKHQDAGKQNLSLWWG